MGVLGGVPLLDQIPGGCQSSLTAGLEDDVLSLGAKHTVEEVVGSQHELIVVLLLLGPVGVAAVVEAEARVVLVEVTHERQLFFRLAPGILDVRLLPHTTVLGLDVGLVLTLYHRFSGLERESEQRFRVVD